MLALIRPTRGLEFAESVQAVEENLEDFDGRWQPFRSWDRPIPDCFNGLVSEALESGADHLWIVEEDVVPPAGGLRQLFGLKTDLAAIPYPLKIGRPGRMSVGRWPNGRPWAGTGCLLVRRQVFEAVDYPWFRVDRAIALIHAGSSTKEKTLALVPRDPERYGGHDNYFSWAAQETGFSLGVVERTRCRHLELEGLGFDRKNNGCHLIADV